MEAIYSEDAYCQRCSATVTSAEPGAIRLDRTVFYPMGGGQPGDTGHLVLPDGRQIAIVDTRKGDNLNDVVHVPDEDVELPAVGSQVEAVIDWDRRYRLMRMHTSMHLLCSLIEGDVTGGQVGENKSRLDFNLPDTRLDKEAITEALNRLIEEDHAVRPRWITDQELEANASLVRTMSVKPPSGAGRVRLLEIDGVDLQPCGGTHVKQTGEIGRLVVTKIENKGRQNRRVNIALQ